MKSENLKEKEGTTSAYGLWRYGNDYHNAAMTLFKHHSESAFTPFFSSIAQSIELSLKAFLLAKGHKLSKLRYKFGHDLAKLLLTSIDNDIEKYVNSISQHFGVIDLLNIEYKNKRYHYIKTGMLFLPDVHLILNASSALTVGLENFCFEKTEWTNDQEKTGNKSEL